MLVIREIPVGMVNPTGRSAVTLFLAPLSKKVRLNTHQNIDQIHCIEEVSQKFQLIVED